MYPFHLLRRQSDIFPLFGNQLEGEPYIFDFSSRNPKTLSFDTTDFDGFQQIVFDELRASTCTWGIGRYLEERSTTLRNYPQMISEGRIFHAGVDVIVPAGFQVHAPVAGTVFLVGKEEEVGSYGGYVVLRHEGAFEECYSLYGHLNAKHVVQEGDILQAGDILGSTGNYADSGGWFTHTHLQIITRMAHESGYMFKGYVTADDLRTIEKLFPSPYPLFRY
ncbi:hypothetical protein COU78_01210 [Candidatus Peregrinibacteria bacterium CG10_big_fil_rev_8_21_14_0_10_49_24]|nr:MAG: hypothetical protein COV83_04175 [Candidatus Peregrinibacteria bacterium CG11_big_fil_rev_8_21_14_0_20_49_14]PIR51345.1 MAG: hypothetical protein COU78_01210 [Candidatus Peregrinibacteria bacterium CG10_big_fil_rev_8_21_14_0_10_49_24]PJA68109.1 MAG: hypothetical protein CO157_01025 [Candidatus Peregrinibacteria bacterium CG_4_9_14_3_um_filter_49_12]